jgi:hypothetical protein
LNEFYSLCIQNTRGTTSCQLVTAEAKHRNEIANYKHPAPLSNIILFLSPVPFLGLET